MAGEKEKEEDEQHLSKQENPPQEQSRQQSEASATGQDQQRSASVSQVASTAATPNLQRQFQPDYFSTNVLAQLQAIQQQQQQQQQQHQQQQSANALSVGSRLSPAVAPQMNFPVPIATTMQEAYGTAAQRQQLLSALLSEGLGQHNLEALQRIPHVDHSHALSTVNRALQQQLLMSELFRSPNSAQRSIQGLSQHYNALDRMPFPPFSGSQQLQPQQQGPHSNQQQQQANPSLGAMLPPRTLDLVRTQPQHGPLSMLGNYSLSASCMPMGLGGQKGLDLAPFVMGDKNLDKTDASQDKNKGENKGTSDDEKGEEHHQSLPASKRRKIVNFKLEQAVNGESATLINLNEAGPARRHDAHLKDTFPLPALTEDEVKRVRLDVPPGLLSFKKAWENLDKATKNRKPMLQEFFRRRLHKGRAPHPKR